MEETPGGALAAQVGYAADLVREYERFIQIKTDAEDWTSMVMSPPLHRDRISNFGFVLLKKAKSAIWAGAPVIDRKLTDLRDAGSARTGGLCRRFRRRP